MILFDVYHNRLSQPNISEPVEQSGNFGLIWINFDMLIFYI